MAIISELEYCPSCDTTVPIKRKKPRHVLHAVLSLFTGGLWLIVWAAMGLECKMSKSFGFAKKCPKCKAKMPR